jgi:hypothetical protein
MQILREKNPGIIPKPARSEAPKAPSQTFGSSSPAPAPMLPPMPAQSQALPRKAVKILKRLAQDERNAFIFYTHFSKNAQNEKKELFANLAKDSNARLELYVELISQNANEHFAPQETEINTAIETSDAIVLALSEENKGLVALGNLIELTADTPAEKSLGRALNRKIIGHQLLLALRFDKFPQE